MTREEIEKSLRICVGKSGCAGCSFKSGSLSLPGCLDNLLSAVANMLEQDARPADTGKMRPYTLDELDLLNVGVLGGTPIWIEHRSDRPNVLKWEFSGWQVLQWMERDHMVLNNGMELDLEDLNKDWRCWKRQPTQEETANASWEDEE